MPRPCRGSQAPAPVSTRHSTSNGVSAARGDRAAARARHLANIYMLVEDGQAADSDAGLPAPACWAAPGVSQGERSYAALHFHIRLRGRVRADARGVGLRTDPV